MTSSRNRASKAPAARPSKPAATPPTNEAQAKRGRGRPELPEGAARTERLVVKLRPDEKAQLQAEADAVGLPLMLYCRLLLFRKGIPDAR